MFRTANALGVLGLLLGSLATFGRGGEPDAQAAESQTTVVAELFTSEGCSSCPPADEVLIRLVHSQLVSGVTVVALGEHVDYWDRLGWRDPFSSAFFSQRQSAYDAQVFRTGRIYTPQIVVDGQIETVGSDEPAVHAAVRKAAQSAKANMTVASASIASGTLRVALRVEVPSHMTLNGPAEVMIAVTEDRLATNVRRGENGGRVLKHAAVVRSLVAVGQLSPQDRVHATTVEIPIAPEWKSENLRVVAFLQERGTRRIVGASSRSVG